MLALTIAGCAGARIAPYDEITDSKLVDLARKVDVALTRLTTPSPSAHQSARMSEAWAFTEIHADFRALRLRNEARDNRPGIEQVDAIEAAWNAFEAQYRAGPVSPAFVEISRTIMAQAFRAAIKLEIEKRRLR